MIFNISAELSNFFSDDALDENLLTEFFLDEEIFFNEYFNTIFIKKFKLLKLKVEKFENSKVIRKLEFAGKIHYKVEINFDNEVHYLGDSLDFEYSIVKNNMPVDAIRTFTFVKLNGQEPTQDLINNVNNNPKAMNLLKSIIIIANSIYNYLKFNTPKRPSKWKRSLSIIGAGAGKAFSPDTLLMLHNNLHMQSIPTRFRDENYTNENEWNTAKGLENSLAKMLLPDKEKVFKVDLDGAFRISYT